MLNAILRPHRSALRANWSEPQKLYVMLKLIPQEEVARARPPLALALVVDTSGSMYEFADQARAKEEARKRGLTGSKDQADGGEYRAVDLGLATKLDQATQAAHHLIDDDRLAADDQVTVIHFDDNAKTLLPLTPLSGKQAAHQAVDSLRKHSGGTHMGKGMRCALDELQSLPAQVAKRAVLLTDGQTFDEPQCRSLLPQFTQSNTPIIAIGIGEEYNDDLMRELSDATQGRPYHLQSMEQLRDILDTEVGSSVREVVTDLQAMVSSVRGAQLDGVTRVYPSLAEVKAEAPYRLGNIAAGDFTVFILEFTVAGLERPPSRARLAQVALVGHAPGLGRREELPPQDISINFTTDETAVAGVDPEVLGYVQQKNVDNMVQQAIRQVTVDASKARQTLQVAAGMTQRLGNKAVTQMLENALDELNRTGAISPGTRRTVGLGGRTQTMKPAGTQAMEGLPSEEEIRRVTGA